MKILFGVQGTGNGHITRCRTLALAFKEAGVEVDYIFSGRDPKDYFDMQAFSQYRTFSGMTFETTNGKINLRKTIKRIHAFRLIKDVKELDLSDYDCIISDFEPVSAWAAKHQQLDCIGISNQAVTQYIQPKEYGFIARAIMKFYAPVSRPIALHWFHFDHPLIPPIVDKLEPSQQKDHIVVYLPFESIEDIKSLLTPFSDQTFYCFHPSIKQSEQVGHISLHPLCRDHFTRSVAQSAGIITNTGFALISEALVLGKKILTKPVSGQFEQLYNADCLEKLDLAQVMQTLEQDKVKHWLTLPSPDPVVYPNVAKELVNWIVNNQKEDFAQLSRRLWSQVKYPAHVENKIRQLGYQL